MQKDLEIYHRLGKVQKAQGMPVWSMIIVKESIKGKKSFFKNKRAKKANQKQHKMLSLNEKKKNRLSLNKYYQLTNKANINNWRSILLGTLRLNHKHLFGYIKSRKPAKEAVGPLDHKCVNGLLREIDRRKPGLILFISLKKVWDKYLCLSSFLKVEFLKN